MKTSFTIGFAITLFSALVHGASSLSLNSVPQLEPSPSLETAHSLEAASSSQPLVVEVNDFRKENSDNDSDREGIHRGDSEAWDENLDRMPSDGSDEKKYTGLIEGETDHMVIANDGAVDSPRPGGLSTPHGNLQPIDDETPSLRGSDITNLIEGEPGNVNIPNDDPGGSTRPGSWAPPLGPIQPPDIASGSSDFDHEDCIVLEQAIGIGVEFQIAAKCECSGDSANDNLEISCAFDGCAPGTETCGHVHQTFVFGDDHEKIKTIACTTFDDEKLEETCITYEIDAKQQQDDIFGITTIPTDSGDGNSGSNSPTCEATYGGAQCECSIKDDDCLSVDCSSFLTGAKIDNCQLLAMDDFEDTNHWIPNFEMFQPNFLQPESSSSFDSSRGRAVALTTVVMATTSLLFGQIW